MGLKGIGPGSESTAGRLTAKQSKWLAHFRSCDGGADSIAAYCQREGLNVRAMYSAGKTLAAKGHLPNRVSQKGSASPPRLATVRLSQGPAAGAVTVELRCGTRLSWQAPNAHAVAELVMALRQPPA